MAKLNKSKTSPPKKTKVAKAPTISTTVKTKVTKEPKNQVLTSDLPGQSLTEKVFGKTKDEIKALRVRNNALNRDQANRYKRVQSSRLRDIAPLPIEGIDWERRLACKQSLQLFCETYLKTVFYMDWSADQLLCIQRIEEVCRSDGKFALAMPRGGGKTALCRAGIMWATAYGYRKFAFFVSTSAPKSTQTLSAMKMNWYTNQKLRDDFPEIGYPVYRLEGRQNLASGQLYEGNPTHIIWTGDSIRYPSLVLPKEIAEAYANNDPDSVEPIEYEGLSAWMTKSSGCVVRTSGIDGSIRGEAETHPLTLAQPRPDLILLDDVQKDQRAESPVMCQKLISMIDGAVQGLAGPGKQIAALMPCTVIRDGDVSDTYLSPEKKPEWNGHKCQMVLSWPPGITNFEVTTATPAGQAWLQYDELRRESLRRFGDFSLATQHYQENREVMDENFTVSWKDRFTTSGKLIELSAQQHAMNLRFGIGDAFLPEYQNIGRKPESLGTMLITADQLSARILNYKRFELPIDTEYVVAHIDVQNEILFYTVLAVSQDFNGIFTTYGTWPQIQYRHFTKGDTESWSMLTSDFFDFYPEFQSKAVRDAKGRLRAPLEAKIYHALSRCVQYLESLNFTRKDNFKRQFSIQKIGIDTRWGEASDVIKRYIRESNKHNLLVPYQGQFISPANRQIEEYEWRRGWLFENQKHPHIKEPIWYYKPNPDGMYQMVCDVSRAKDFLFRRLASPLGSSGSIGLFDVPPQDHDLFAHHICDSEEPIEMAMKGRVKNQWKMVEPKRSDNDWLDAAAACMALASYAGASLKTTDQKPIVHRRRLSSYVKGRENATR